MDAVRSLSRDENPTVRSGVLESLAEIIYAFHEDKEGPPAELIRMFLGIREEDDPARAEKQPPKEPSPPSSPMSWNDFISSISGHSHAQEDLDIYDDQSRPLVCAFNFPAVALTLGREKWSELRDLYLLLSENPSFKVRRTLAASLGEMAKILGSQYAHQDLMRVWWSSVRSEEGDVRLKAVECLPTFMVALDHTDRAEVLQGLIGEVWQKLKGWREREGLMKALASFPLIAGLDPSLLRQLLRKGLDDPVARVREEAVSAVRACFRMSDSQLTLLRFSSCHLQRTHGRKIHSSCICYGKTPAHSRHLARSSGG